jgi:hypothetical protein
MSLSIDKIQITELVAFMLLLQNYHTDCYTITYPPPMENDPPPVENESHPSSEISQTPPVEIKS